MSKFQSNTIISSILIAILRFLFCTALIDIDIYVWVLGALASISIGLWIWWQQKWMWFVWITLTVLTAISFVFSIIPVYNHSPNLDILYVSQIPNIQCSPGTKWNISLWVNSISMQDICTRWFYPLLTNQQVKNETDNTILISLGLWKSVYLWVWQMGKIQKASTWYELIWNSNTPSSILTSDQITLKNEFNQEKATYLRTNFWWRREHAPSITTISLRKMRLLSLIDRRYNTRISWLEFYMREISN